ncbi:MAG: response regulator transcription factor [Chloroflexi bacterium]|uniref:response regulator transcription factor n=1 Tax=Candidatus Flexifilum breve TaxID=3140694 RepID=UPI003134A4AC|nr:response regulator transcription factor [Chloroflexota bacterium]
MTHILIADSSSLTVLGAETLLKGRAHTFTSTAENADDLCALAQRYQPTLILLGDPFDPLVDLFTLFNRLRQCAPHTPIIVMGTIGAGLIIHDLFYLGIRGYLTKEDDLADCLLTAVDVVLRERPYLSPTANSEYLLALQTKQEIWQLDEDERTVLRLLARGQTAREIAAQMQVSRRRVYWITEKLRYRFGAATNEHLINRANTEGFRGFTD